MTWLALRSVFWTFVLPGTMAFYIPVMFFGLGRLRLEMLGLAQLPGLVCFAIGIALLIMTIVEFARSGRGTLSPLDPPRELVVRGLYRYVRNPMYAAVVMIILGEAMVLRSAALALYLVIWFAMVNLFVMGYEEPTLRRTFGASYDAYARRVGRWIPHVPR